MADNAISLDWPAWVGFAPGFDLVIENRGGTACELATTRLFNPRFNLRPLLQGEGIEVGPGTNPFVKADANTSVRYVEAAPIETWVSNYGKSLDAENLKDLWASYIIGDAVTLDIIPDGSLDFIFSSHVFEHLNNPIQVLENWSSKLKAGGFVVAVIPDLRYCFDLRQPPSDPSDWIEEYTSQAHGLSLAKYEKWCRYTAPYATPESLIERNYSIHAHYYTSDTIIELAEIVQKRGWYDRVFLNASPNNKDFGIALRRSTR
jgi:SAM-dependent methyltransferase